MVPPLPTHRHLLKPVTALLALSLLLQTAPAFSLEATAPDTNGQKELSAGIRFEHYLLGPGDVLKITDENNGTLADNIRVLADGTLNLPLLGAVSVSGKPLPEVNQALNQAYAKYFKNPAITLHILTQRPFRIYVTGAVKAPGMYVSGKNLSPENSHILEVGESNQQQAHNGLKLTEALMMAGGLNLNANVHKITIQRKLPAPESFDIDLWSVFQDGKVESDINLQDGDVVSVAQVENEQILWDKDWETLAKTNISNVIGAVKAPGSYEVKAADTVVAALAKAGGFNNVAQKSRIYLVRSGGNGQLYTREVDLSKAGILAKKPLETWGRLMPGDVVFVEDSAGRKTLANAGKLINNASSSFLFVLFNRLISK
jgi:polysaccharide export outer membrane protein